MPSYTFHVDNGHRISGDLERLPNNRAAKRKAEEIARDLSRNRTFGNNRRVVATNEQGEQVADVPIPSTIT